MNAELSNEIKEIHVREILQLFYPDTYKDIHIKVYKEENFVICEYEGYKCKENINVSLKNATKKATYKCISKKENKTFPYGILTGVKPLNVLNEYKNEEKEKIINILKEDYLVSEEKINLMLLTKENQKKYENHTGVSFYVHIPFCPSKCSYCSFPSVICNEEDNKLKDYVHALVKEIKSINEVLKEKKVRIESIYVGGGTPGILNKDLMEILLKELNSLYSFDFIREFSFELGRSELISEDKLNILNKYRVNRVCINPQSLNKEVLKKYNRPSSIGDYYSKIIKAKKHNIDIINSDLIMGLDEDISNFFFEVATLIELGINNITLHSLALKRASDTKNINFENKDFYIVQKECIDFLIRNDYMPYYLYKQKNAICMGENIGFAKKGKECIYNIRTMTDNNSVIAVGAGGAGKIFQEDGTLYRVDTTKDTNIYIKDIDNIINRKLRQYTLNL